MFEATFNDGAGILRKLVDILKDNLTEAVLIAKPGHGLCLQSMDNAHVALVDFFLNFDVASNFFCTEEYQWGINFESLAKIFKSSTAHGICRIRYNPKHPDHLTLTFQAEKKKSTFKFKLCDVDVDEHYGIPDDMHHRCEEPVDAAELQRVIKDLLLFSEQVVVSRFGNKLAFTATGDITDSHIEFDVDGDPFEGNLASTYSLKYLAWFCRAASICREATLAFDKDVPLLLHFNDGDDVSLKFFVAAKYNENEDQVSENLERNVRGQSLDDEDDELRMDVDDVD